VLIETGFMSHPEEEAFLLNENSQESIAGAIGQGLVSYLQSQGVVLEKTIENENR
jgi:N-acetylmuramoyl-L-alanine amidase